MLKEAHIGTKLKQTRFAQQGSLFCSLCSFLKFIFLKNTAKAKLFLFHSLLRQEKYPATAEAFAQSNWAELVVAPLRTIAQDPLFDVSPQWLEPVSFSLSSCPLLV